MIYQRYINDISTHISMINQWFDFIWFGCLTHYGACFFFSPKTLLFSIHLRPYQTRTSRQTPFTTILFLHSTMHLSITCRRDTFTNHEWYHLVWHWPYSHSLTRHDGHRHVYLHTIQLLQPRIFLQIIKHSTYDTTLNPTQTMHSHSETAKLMTVTVSNHSIFTAIHPLIKVRKWANIGSAMQQSTSYAILSQSQAIAITHTHSHIRTFTNLLRRDWGTVAVLYTLRLRSMASLASNRVYECHTVTIWNSKTNWK